MIASPHVLVVDDEPHIGRIIKMKLEQGPFRVTVAADGGAALDALAQHPDIAAVVLDVMMPVRSGFEVLAEMRASAQWRETPCLILTAAGQAVYQERALALGATDFMTKPFSPKKLMQRTAELVGVPPAAPDALA